MQMRWDSLGPQGLGFFGRMSASVSHDIKNSLAVINENAGLMQDLLAMAEKGRPLDPARLASIAERVRGQVKRADEVARSLNRFAHTVDQPVKSVDMVDAVRLSVALHTRAAALKEAGLEIGDMEDVDAETNPFLMANLVSLCLVAALDAAGAGGKVTISVSDAGSRVRISLIYGQTAAPVPDQVRDLLDALDAELAAGPGRMDIYISKRAPMGR